MYKIFKFIKNFYIYAFASFLIITKVFAVAVSDNDGAVFISKAEFDNLKNTFQSQLDSYNQSIDNKIESAIASYLAGIKTESTFTVFTGINSNGNSNVVKFLGKTYASLNHNKEPYGYDDLKITAVKSFSNFYIAARETYHYYIYQAYNKFGNTTNFVMHKDTNNRILEQRKNYTIKYFRNIITYSNNVANYGGGWVSLSTNLGFPTAESTTALADTLKGTHIGWNMNTTGGSRGKGTTYPFPGQYIDLTPVDPDIGISYPYNGKYAWSYLTNGEDQPATSTYTPTPANYTPVNSTFNWVTRNGSFSYGGTTDNNVYHWPKGANDKIYCVDNDFDNMLNAEKASPSEFKYTRSVKFNNMPGLNADNYKAVVTIMNGTNTVVGEDKGYGIKVKSVLKAPNEIYYNNSYSIWGIESPMGNGFNFYYNNSESGDLEFKLKGNAANAKLYFKNSPYATTDDSGTTNMIEFEIKQGTGAFSKTKKFNMAANVEYTIKLKYKEKTELKLFAIPSADNGSVDITQVGQATLKTGN